MSAYLRPGAILLAALGLFGAGAFARTGPDRPKSVPEGSWGGNHIGLVVGPEGARVEFDTAHGTIDKPLALDGEGRFDLPGKLVMEHPGPVRMGEKERVEETRFQGSLEDQTLTLQVTFVKSGRLYGKFTATLGGTPRTHKMY
jgi:hypothetical protein